MNKVLVTYATMSGSTAEVAQAVRGEITGKGFQVEVTPIGKVTDLDAFDAIVLGAPMVMGWHRSALSFIKKNRKELKNIPLAIFATAMSLTSTNKTSVKNIPVWVDENLAKPPQNPSILSFRERYANVNHYIAPMLKACGAVRPVSIAFFGGRLDYQRLKLPAKLFVMLVIQSQPGDRRNWPAIQSWAAGLPGLFNSRNAGN
jgi:menaquinone-dependent protoporphyrinogen oxidase